MVKTEAKFNELMQMIASMSVQNQARQPLTGTTLSPVGNMSSTRGDTGGDPGSQGGDVGVQNIKGNRGKATRLEFPKFEGEGFDGWLMGEEYFFESELLIGIEVEMEMCRYTQIFQNVAPWNPSRRPKK